MAAPVILDHRLRPMRSRQELLTREISAATVTGVRSVLPTRSMAGIDAASMAAMLRQAETPGGAEAEPYLELAEAMEELDLHYLGVLQTRKRQVSQLPTSVDPATDSADHVRDADLVREFLGRRSLVDELYDVLDALGKGYSVAEIVWDTSAAPLIEPVLRRARTDPDGLLDDIAAVYPEMDAEALTERLARILFVADVYGRADAS